MLTTCECDSILRADLETKSESDEPSSPDPVLQAELRKRLEHTYAALSLAEGDTGGRTQEYTANVEWHADTDGEEYDFRLFAKSSQSGKRDGVHEEPQRIVLRSPSPVNGRSGFRNGGRPKKYYFTGTPSVDSVEQYRQAAVSGEELIAGLKTRWLGCELPWRVKIIEAKAPIKDRQLEYQFQPETNKRKRSGKKRRVTIRKRLEAMSAKIAAARQIQTEKLAAEKDKRTRKNREKKVKKRQKEKLKKTREGQATG